MKEIQEEAKRRFPIGCYFIRADEERGVRKLENDNTTYEICGSYIYANGGNGCLYKSGKWATLVDKNGNPINYTTTNNLNYEIF